MKNNLFSNIISITETAALALATMFVAVFVLFGLEVFLLMALILYVIAFGAMAIGEGITINLIITERKNRANKALLADKADNEIAVTEKVLNNSNKDASNVTPANALTIEDSEQNALKQSGKKESVTPIAMNITKLCLSAALSLFSLILLILY